jgi:hypothetical protein
MKLLLWDHSHILQLFFSHSAPTWTWACSTTWWNHYWAAWRWTKSNWRRRCSWPTCILCLSCTHLQSLPLWLFLLLTLLLETDWLLNADTASNIKITLFPWLGSLLLISRIAGTALVDGLAHLSVVGLLSDNLACWRLYVLSVCYWICISSNWRHADWSQIAITKVETGFRKVS